MRKIVKGLFQLNLTLAFVCLFLSVYYTEIAADTYTANLFLLGLVGTLVNLALLVPITVFILRRGF